MTINIEELKRDRDAGTDGPYTPENPMLLRHGNVALANYETDEGSSNARRIARLPDLEAAFLEAVELLDRWNVWACGQMGYSPFQDARDFLEKLK